MTSIQGNIAPPGADDGANHVEDLGRPAVRAGCTTREVLTKVGFTIYVGTILAYILFSPHGALSELDQSKLAHLA